MPRVLRKKPEGCHNCATCGYTTDRKSSFEAHKNRKVPSYMVEIPQGQESFEPTNKKHFQRIGYYSTIGD